MAAPAAVGPIPDITDDTVAGITVAPIDCATE